MEKIFIKDICEKDAVDTVFLVTRKINMTGKAHPFIALQLRDKTGTLDARIWDDLDGMGAGFDKGDHIHVKGHVIEYQGRLQLKVDTAEKADASLINPDDYAEPPKPAPGDRSLGQIREMISLLQDPNLKALCQSFLGDEELMKSMRTLAAARSIHHSHPGGLADHTLSVMKLSLRAADQYPMADRDMLIAGAFLHDIGKLRELCMADRQAEYTDEGRFIGHLVIGAQMIHDRCASLKNFPAELETQLTHLVLAHHGTLEFGSPRPPQTLEAIIVHYMDDLDSKVGALLEICQRDPSSNEHWTDFQKQYNRYFYKGATATIHGKYAFESKKRRAQAAKEAAEKARAERAKAAQQPDASAAAQAKQAPAPAADQKQTRRERKDGEKSSGDQKHESRKPSQSSSGEMKFKPFEALAKLELKKANDAADASGETSESIGNDAGEVPDTSLPPAEATERTVDDAINAAISALTAPETSDGEA